MVSGHPKSIGIPWFDRLSMESPGFGSSQQSCLIGRRMVQSLRRSMMTDYSRKEKAVAATSIFKMKMQ